MLDMDLDNRSMSRITTEPITPEWTSFGTEEAIDPTSTAAAVNARLAQFDIADIDAGLVPYLAAAAAELALVAGIAWPFSADDPAVALLRIIAKVTMRRPDAGGPHTARLHEQLVGANRAGIAPRLRVRASSGSNRRARWSARQT